MSKRSEMNPEFMWNFSDIYPAESDWEAAYRRAEESLGGIEKLRGTLGASADSLKSACDELYSAMEVAERVYIYAMLHKSADSSDTRNQEMEARAMTLMTKLYSAVSFFDPELLAIPAEKFEAYAADEKLAVYRHALENTARARAHTLDAERENMLALLSDAQSAPSDAYDMLADVELQFPDITDEDGKPAQVTRGNFNVYRISPERRVRAEAFESVFGAYKKFENTIAALYTGSVKFDAYNARVRNYASAREHALFAGNVPTAVYDSLISAVHSSLPTMRKYLELRKRALGMENIDMFDLYTPIVPDVDVKMPYESAQTLVKNALKPLGEGYQKLLDEAFGNKWVDVYENAGKRSGAFSCGLFGVHPYVLTNYSGTLDDAFTLAHELGHAMHSYYSDHTQAYANHDYSIMVAEVASTVNEVLLSMYLLKTEKDPMRRAYVLNHFLEGFRTTVFRQTLFAEFEMRTHDMYDAGTPLTADALNKLYHELVAKYYEGIGINETIDIEWAYIPHFYRAFYVYQYATGFCSAVAIAKKILETGDASGYLKFLSLGGSDYPIEELKVAGVDLTDPNTVIDAMKVFDETIDELTGVLGK